MKQHPIYRIVTKLKAAVILPFCLFALLLLSSCSLTKNIPEDDQLFRGLKEIAYIDEQDHNLPENKTLEENKEAMKEEVEAALATTFLHILNILY